MAKKYLSLEEAAKRLGLSTDELIRRREKGDVRGYADRGTWKFKIEDIDEFRRSHEIDSHPEVPILDNDDTDMDQLLVGSDSDIVVEQFRPGVMKRLGWDYPAAKAVNEKIIYCSLTGYGQNGPMRDRAGHDLNYLSLSGMMSYTGREDTGPTPFATQVADINAGSYNLVVGVLAALFHLQRTGEGQFIDVSMFDGSVALNAIAGAQYLTDGRESLPGREMLNGGTFYDCYRTKDGRYLSAGGLEPKFLYDFLKGLERNDLAEPGDSMAAMKNVNEAKKVVSEIIGGKTLAEWQPIFAKTTFIWYSLNFIVASR